MTADPFTHSVFSFKKIGLVGAPSASDQESATFFTDEVCLKNINQCYAKPNKDE